MNKIAIIISKKDEAGMNIRERLLETSLFTESNKLFDSNRIYDYTKDKNDNSINHSIIKLYTVEKDSVYNENIDKEIDADLFIFATKHQSRSGIHSLSSHVQGNFGIAEYGGSDKKLGICPASYIFAALTNLTELNSAQNLSFEVVQECTHHGPFMEKPSLFIEIGSDISQWQRIDAAQIIVKTILYLIDNPISQKKAIIGIGGQHTCTNFKKLTTHNLALAHVCPKYMLDHLDKEMIIQMIEKNIEKIEMIVLDWKGLGEHKQRIKSICEEICTERNILLKKTNDF